MRDLFKTIIGMLPKNPDESQHGIWVNDIGDIVCTTESYAYGIFNLLEECGAIVGMMATVIDGEWQWFIFGELDGQ